MLARQEKIMLFYVNVFVHGLPLFQAMISIDRIGILLFRLLFDDETTCNKRIKNDCFTYTREI